MSEKTKGEQLREELLMNPKNLTETMSEEELKAAYDFCEGYKTFLDAAKTEREAVTTAVAMLEKAGVAAVMANGMPQIKALADLVTTADCDHDGVAEVFETLGL